MLESFDFDKIKDFDQIKLNSELITNFISNFTIVALAAIWYRQLYDRVWM